MTPVPRGTHSRSGSYLNMSNADFNWTSIVGAAATLCSMISFGPQAWKIIISRNTEGISAKMYTLTVAAFGLWLAYGLLLGDWALIATNLACLILSTFIWIMVLIPKQRMERVAETIEKSVSKN
jgi:MtN3 and saliva related transmembrane protein